MKQNEIKARDICRQYRDAKRGVLIAEKGLEAILSKMESAKAKSDRTLFELAFKCKQDEIKKLRDIIITFETCIDILSEEERSVIEQLYVKGRKWEEVTDMEGNLYPIGKVMGIRGRALRRMEKFI